MLIVEASRYIDEYKHTLMNKVLFHHDELQCGLEFDNVPIDIMRWHTELDTQYLAWAHLGRQVTEARLVGCPVMTGVPLTCRVCTVAVVPLLPLSVSRYASILQAPSLRAVGSSESGTDLWVFGSFR